MSNKKYYRDYYKKNKDKINKRRRENRKLRKEEPFPFSFRNRGITPNNEYKRMFVEDILKKKSYGGYLIDFYVEKGRKLFMLGQILFYIVLFLAGITITFIVLENEKWSGFFLFFQVSFLALQVLTGMFHYINHRRLVRIYEEFSERIIEKIKEVREI